MPDITHQEIDDRFSFHPATTKDRGDAHAAVRAACGALAHQFVDTLPAGRDKRRAIDALDDAMMYANAAVARQDHVGPYTTTTH